MRGWTATDAHDTVLRMLDEDPAIYKVMLVARLPEVEPFDGSGCMAAAITWPHRLARQLVPQHRSRGCCWYHAADWHLAARAAIRIARQVGCGVPRDSVDMLIAAEQLLDASCLPEREREAAYTLLFPADGIQLAVLAGDRWPSYINGQHRSYVMLQTGVRRTVVIEWPDG